MKNIELNKMEIRNFKGIDSLTVNFGERTDIYGDNATGKTSVYDAFTWLLFGKDSQEKAKFEVKPLDEQGVLRNREAQTEATAELIIDGEAVKLTKVLITKMPKKNGTNKREELGSSNKYFINDVPTKESEFNGYINGILAKDKLRLLCDVEAFNRLEWQVGRNIILSICGEPSNVEVLALNPDLSAIKDLINKYTAEQIKEVYTGKKRTLNVEKSDIRVRIDTALEIIGNAEPQDTEYQKEILAEREEQLKELMSERSRIASDLYGAKEKEKDSINAQLRELELKNREYVIEQRAAYEQENAEVIQKKTKLEGSISGAENIIRQLQFAMQSDEKLCEQMRAEYSKIYAEQWTCDTVCPTCGQELPEDKIKASQEAFKTARSEKLMQNKAAGQEVSARIQTAKEELKTWEEQLKGFQAELAALPEIEPFIPSNMPEYEASKKLLENKLAQLEHAPLETAVKEQIDTIDKQIESVKSEINELNGEIIAEEQRAEARRVIEKYKAREKALAAELEEVESVLFMTEQFVRAKVSLIENKIGERFKKARFKLFNLQVNGGISECCEITYNGVPYGSLNNAARINIGIDIINTLAEHYGVCAPIFVDNAESIVHIEPSDGQQIRLIVSAQDKELRIENTNKLTEVA